MITFAVFIIFCNILYAEIVFTLLFKKFMDVTLNKQMNGLTMIHKLA